MRWCSSITMTETRTCFLRRRAMTLKQIAISQCAKAKILRRRTRWEISSFDMLWLTKQFKHYSMRWMDAQCMGYGMRWMLLHSCTLCCTLLLLSCFLLSPPACHRLLSYRMGKTETETELKLRVKSYVLLLPKATCRPGLRDVTFSERWEFIKIQASSNKEGVTD